MERNQDDINLIYQQTHNDYKGEGSLIMYGDPVRGTMYAPIENMPEAIYQTHLARAKKAQKRAARNSILKVLFNQFGIDHLYHVSQQILSSKSGVRNFITPRVKAAQRIDFLHALNQSKIMWD